jgi:hypothetical protein
MSNEIYSPIVEKFFQFVNGENVKLTDSEYSGIIYLLVEMNRSLSTSAAKTAASMYGRFSLDDFSKSVHKLMLEGLAKKDTEVFELIEDMVKCLKNSSEIIQAYVYMKSIKPS